MKKIFIAGYSGDIGSNLVSYLEKSKEKKHYEVHKLNARLDFENLNKYIQENIMLGDEIVLVSCVGIGVYGMFHELGESDFGKSFDGNFYAPLKIVKIFVDLNLELFKKTGKKQNIKIININSKSAKSAFFQGVAYNSAKAAIDMALRVIQKEYKKYGLVVSQLYPGVIKTKMNHSMPYMPKSGIKSVSELVGVVCDEIFG